MLTSKAAAIQANAAKETAEGVKKLGERLDRIEAALAEIRAEISGAKPAPPSPRQADAFAAQERGSKR